MTIHGHGRRWLAAAAAALAVAGTAALAEAPPERVRTEAREILRTTVAYRTAAGLGQVPAMAEFLAARLRAGGFAAEDVHVLPLGETASLVARYGGNGSGGRPILLVAHMDVVPARAEEWERDPFTLVEEGGYFFGRGTTDIKSDIAAIVATLLRLKREGFVPTRDLVLALTGDEETDQATTRDLVENHRDLIDAELAINGDGGGGVLAEDSGAPVVYYLQGAEKAYATFELVARNAGGHSSEPRADNAIYDLAAALERLAAYRFPVEWNEWTIGSFRAAGDATEGDLGRAMRAFAADPLDADAADALWREPTLVGRTRTTCVATMLAGGHAENALPQTATATVNCRIFPGTGAEAVRATMAKVVGEKVAVRLAGRDLAAVASPLRDDVLAAVTAAVHASRPGVPIVPDMAPYYTDGSVLRAAGIATYGVSGMFLKASDSFSHGLNERMSVAAFDAGLTHWYVLLRELGGRR